MMRNSQLIQVIRTTQSRMKESNPKTIYNAIIKSKVYVNQFPERDIFPIKSTLNDATRNKKSVEINKNRMKSVIISDSITKRFYMMNSTRDDNGNALKRVFPGATALQLNLYVQATIDEEKPDNNNLCRNK